MVFQKGPTTTSWELMQHFILETLNAKAKKPKKKPKKTHPKKPVSDLNFF